VRPLDDARINGAHVGLLLVMCFVMGLGVGGMLPIVFTLIAETIPSRHRGWLMVLIGGDVAGAYILTSWLSSTLVPEYSWRILWLIGLPTGLLLIVLNRWIPESPRLLLAHGRNDPDEPAQPGLQRGHRRSDPARLGADRLSAELPRRLALRVLEQQKTIVLLAGLTAIALLGFAVAGDAVADDRVLLNVLLVVPIWGISSLVAVLAAYSAEVYPTRIRSRGSGLTAAMSKAGGVVIIAVVVVAIAPPTITGTALVGAIPMGLAALAAAVFGIETRRRRLEEITAQEFEAGAPVGVGP